MSPATSLSMELSGDTEIGTVAMLVSVEIGADSTTLSYRGCHLRDPAKTLEDYGVRSGEILYAGDPPADPDRPRIVELLRTLRTDPYQMSILKQNNPPLAEAAEANDLDAVAELVLSGDTMRREREFHRAKQAAILEQDPFNVEAQRALEEAIRDENVEQLRQSALEHMPESFAEGSIVMLYIDVVVNGQRLKAFVDSGAQMTIMSAACAERTGIMRLVDRRFQGMAVGVGSQKIIGRVHMYELQIGDDHLPTSFSILENQPMDMLLGLDMLKRHRCIIDLQENCLRIGTTGSSTRFLPESEIPAKERLGGPPPGAAGPAEAGGAGAAMDAGGAAAAPPSYPDDLVQRLTKLPSTMGIAGEFSRAQVIEALTVSDGNADRAASYLLEQAAGLT